MTDTAARLWSVAGTAGTALLYTGGASTTTIVRHIRVANIGTVDATFDMVMGTVFSGSAYLNKSTNVVANGGVYDWSGFMVVGTAEKVSWNAGTILTTHASGVQVT